MIPAAFEYERADSVEHALELLGGGSDAKLLAGGHSLLPLMKMRLAQPSMLVDIGRLSDLAYVRDDGDRIAIGALTCHNDIQHNEMLRTMCPIVAYTAGLIGDPQVRNLGTIGGSVAHGDPASDIPTVLLTLGAELVTRGAEGERTIAAADFFKGFFEVDLGSGEVLTEIRVPKTEGAGWSYMKFHPRAQDWAVVGVAAVLNGAPAVGLTTMSQTPMRAAGVEEALASGADPADAAQRADENTSPPSDPMGSAEYRKHLAKVLTKRALEEGMSRRA